MKFSSSRKITLEPLPELSHIIRSFFIKNKNKELYDSWRSIPNGQPFWLSRSIISMKVIIDWYKEVFCKSSLEIYLPEYFCLEPIDILIESGCNISYYNINDDLKPDWSSCIALSKKRTPNIFFLVHFFGKESDIDGCKKFCNQLNCLFVEDASHVLRPYSNIGKKSDFIFYSQHKLFSIPDSSLLVFNPKHRKYGTFNKKDAIKAINGIISKMPNTKPNWLKWIFKRLFQIFFFDFIWLNRRRKKDLKITNLNFGVHQTRFSRNLLSLQKNNIDKFENIKIRNDFLINLGYTNSNNLSSKNSSYITEILARKTTNNDLISKKSSYPLMQWPDLPIAVLQNKKLFSSAIKFSQEKFFLPNHQTIGLGGVKRMRAMFYGDNDILNNLNSCEIISIDKKSYDSFFKEVEKSNYVQFSSYAEAKKFNQGWNIEWHAIKINKKIISIYQSLVKDLLGFKFVRINRGPIPFDKFDYEIKFQILKNIKDKYNLKKKCILLITPELNKNPQNIGLMQLLNYKHTSKKYWESSFVDFSLSLEVLRKNLNSKWRNQLKKSESYKIEIKIGNDSKSFEWLISNYRKLMKKNKFQGPNPQLYQYIFDNFRSNLLLFQAFKDKIPIAGQMFFLHGNTSTYLVGYNSIGGRENYAHNYLIWNAISYLKKSNYKFLDLGGIDNLNTPGIAKFKNGVNGENFGLIGDWISI